MSSNAEVIVPNLVWSAGRTAEAIRTAAVACLCSALQEKPDEPDMTMNMVSKDNNGGGDNTAQVKIKLNLKQIFFNLYIIVWKIKIKNIEKKSSRGELNWQTKGSEPLKLSENGFGDTGCS